MSINVFDTILRKCEIYYGDSLISKEAILERYASFWGVSFASKERRVSIALHTGSICFDIIAVVAAVFSGLAFNFSLNDDVLDALNIDDMIMYNGKRYRWKGTKIDAGSKQLVIEKDGHGRNGKSIYYKPYEKNKHLIKPYYGNSTKTDGRGVRRKRSNREEFLSYIYDLPISEIPVQLNVSIVIVAERAEFFDICKHLKIVYDNNKEIGILDIVPVSYYTSNGTEIQFGTNPTKAEAVLKITGNISTARDVVLDKHGNKVVGMLLTRMDKGSELDDLLRIKSLRFIHIMAHMGVDVEEHVLDLYEDALIFACTKEFLIKETSSIVAINALTQELHHEIACIVANRVVEIPVVSSWSWEDYKHIKNKLLMIKQSDWNDNRKEDFLISSYTLLNIFNTATFSMERMEEDIQCGEVNAAVLSPEARINDLWEIAHTAGVMEDQCTLITDALERQYNWLKKVSPKGDAMFQCIDEHIGEKIVIVLPKFYYAEIIKKMPQYSALGDKAPLLVTANRFDAAQKYDYILVAGDITGTRFNPAQCYASKEVAVLLYEYEKKAFRQKQRQVQELMQKLNCCIQVTDGDKETDIYWDKSENANIVADVEEVLISEFLDFDHYIESINSFDIRNVISRVSSFANKTPLAEVQYIGTFTTGEYILFSKYYQPVVFNPSTRSVDEIPVEKLRLGDLLVFTKRDNYTRNIVDSIYEQLLSAGLLNDEILEASKKASYWKEVLREFQDKQKLTYRDIALKLKEQGSSLREGTIRQWLMEDSHIVGPREIKTLVQIATITQDTYLLSDVHGHFDACRIVRHERRNILELIATAINDKISNHVPVHGSILDIVYNNVESLSEILELENISCLDTVVKIPTNLVNKPISESEVQI